MLVTTGTDGRSRAVATQSQPALGPVITRTAAAYSRCLLLVSPARRLPRPAEAGRHGHGRLQVGIRKIEIRHGIQVLASHGDSQSCHCPVVTYRGQSDRGRDRRDRDVDFRVQLFFKNNFKCGQVPRQDSTAESEDATVTLAAPRLRVELGSDSGPSRRPQDSDS